MLRIVWLFIMGFMIVTLSGFQTTRITGLESKVASVQEIPKNFIVFHDKNEMVRLPAVKKYWIGSNDHSNETPAHQVNIPAFAIDRFEVTNYQYCAFLNAIGRTYSVPEKYVYIHLDESGCHIYLRNGDFVVESGYEFHPVVHVTWYGAQAYSTWVGKRLPHEKEWEYAARGANYYQFSFGDQWDPSLCNNPSLPWSEYHDTMTRANAIRGTTPVGIFPKEIHGTFDMAGNVMEWCSNAYNDMYTLHTKENATDHKEALSGIFNPLQYVARGGSWFALSHQEFHGSARRGFPPDFHAEYLGFRCAGTVANQHK